MRFPPPVAVTAALAAVVVAGGVGPFAAAPTGAQPARQTSAVHVEDSPATMERIERAVRLAEEGRPDEGALELHEVVARHADRLVPVEDGVYQAAVIRVRKLLAGRPDLAEAYRGAFAPEAERAVALATEPRIDESALRVVEREYWFTRAGLEASLLLAGLELERYEPGVALDRLEALRGHADLDAARGRHAVLTAQARLLTGDAATAAEAVEGLGLDEPQRSAVDSFAASLAPGLATAEIASASRPTLGDAGELLDEPLWEIGVQPGPSAEALLQASGQLRDRIVAGALEASVPVAASGSRFVFNDGGSVHAVDRDSGRSLWVYEAESGGDLAANNPALQRQLINAAARGVDDERGVAVARGRAFTVTGFAVAWRPPRGATSQTRLTCLDLATGRPAWSISSGDVDPVLERAEFVGDPQVMGDLVVIAMRRSQVSGLQDVYVAAIDAATGRPAWRRHISSIVTASRRASGPVPAISHRGGLLYVFDQVSVVSCLDARDGLVLWSRKLNGDPRVVEQLMRPDATQWPARRPPPMLIEAGLLVGLRIDGAAAFVLDPATGDVRRRLAGAAWGSGYARLLVDGDVITVARTVRRFDGETLEPAWATALPREALDAPLEIAPALTRDHLVLPTRRGLMLLRLADGGVVRSVGDAVGGRASVVDGQIVLGWGGRVSSYLGWPLAVERLNQAIASRPADPGPALGLAHLSLAAGRPAMLERALDLAVDAAVEAADLPAGAGDAVRARTFTQMRALVDGATAERQDAAAAVLGRMGQLATTPGERATHTLLLAALRAGSGDAAAAVAGYQRVLADAELFEALFESPRASRRAGVEARRRLGALLDERGREAYAAFEAEADAELARLTSGTARSPQQLESLARRYPFADAAATAMIEAAVALDLLGRAEPAVRAAREAYRLTAAGHDEVGRIVGELVALELARGDARRAARVIRQATRKHDGLVLLDDGLPREPDDWLAEVEAMAGDAAALPRWAPPVSSVRRFDAAPLPALSEPAPEDGVFVRSGGRLFLLDPDTLDPVWEFGEVPDDAVVVAAGDPLVIYSPSAGRLQAIDRLTGRPRWAQSSDAAFEGVPTSEAAKDREAPDRRVFLQIVQNRRQAAPPAGPLVAADDGPLVLWADERGRAVALRRDDGTPAWRRTLRIDRVSGLTLSPEAVTLWGRSGVGTEAVAGVVEVLDPETGEPRMGVIESRVPPFHAAVDGDRVVTASASEVASYELDGGALAWRTDIAGDPLAGGGWRDAGSVVFTDARGQGVGVDLDSGEVTWREPFGHGAEQPPLAARATPGSLSVLTPDGFAGVDYPDGVRYRDALHLAQRRLFAMAVTRDHALVVGDDGGARPVLGVAPQDHQAPAVVSLYALERSTGRLVGAFALRPAPTPVRPELTRVTDRWLLLSDGEQTLAVRGDDPPPTPPAPPVDPSIGGEREADAAEAAAADADPPPPSSEIRPGPAP